MGKEEAEQARTSPASAAVRPSNDVGHEAVLYMGEKEQVRPLAPSTFRSSSDGGASAMYIKKMRHKRCIKCCGCVAALLLILFVVVVILIFTVFRVKDPIIKLNGVTVDELDLLVGNTPRTGSNMSLTADVSVKNPNFASFKYRNTTTALFYRGEEIGEARGPPGQAKPRRTMRMNITVDIITDRLMSNPSLMTDMASRLLTVSSFTRVPGRVKILNIVKKHVVVKMNCTMSINVTTRAIEDQKCKRKVRF